MLTLIAIHDTCLKESTADSTDPEVGQTFDITKGTKLQIKAKRPVDAGHEYITLDQEVDGKNSWFIFPGHFEKEGATGDLNILMTPQGACDSYGGEMFWFDMELDGEEERISMGSGLPGLMHCRKSEPGSGRPIPQGLYLLGKTVRESEWQMSQAIGPVWIGLTPQQEINGRDGFLIHMDYNWARSPGSLGCPFPHKNRDMQLIAEWNDEAKSGRLQVDYGY